MRVTGFILKTTIGITAKNAKNTKKESCMMNKKEIEFTLWVNDWHDQLLNEVPLFAIFVFFAVKFICRFKVYLW
jgi:hypothetical protein